MKATQDEASALFFGLSFSDRKHIRGRNTAWVLMLSRQAIDTLCCCFYVVVVVTVAKVNSETHGLINISCCISPVCVNVKSGSRVN